MEKNFQRDMALKNREKINKWDKNTGHLYVPLLRAVQVFGEQVGYSTKRVSIWQERDLCLHGLLLAFTGAWSIQQPDGQCGPLAVTRVSSWPYCAGAVTALYGLVHYCGREKRHLEKSVGNNAQYLKWFFITSPIYTLLLKGSLIHNKHCVISL